MDTLSTVDGKSGTQVKLKFSKMEIAYLEEDNGDEDGIIPNNVFLDIENQTNAVNNDDFGNNNIENNTDDNKETTNMSDNNNIVNNDVNNGVDDGVDVDDIECLAKPPSLGSVSNDEPVVRNGDKMVPFEVEKTLGQHMRILEDEIATKRQIRRRNHCFNSCKNCVFYSVLLYLFLFVNLYLILLFETPIRNLVNLPAINVNSTTGFVNDGQDGRDGRVGRDGQDGRDGRDGKNGSIVFFNSTNYLAELVDNITLMVLDKISTNGVLNIREVHSDIIYSTDLIVNMGNLSFVNSLSIDSTDYTGIRFNRCVSGWC